MADGRVVPLSAAMRVQLAEATLTLSVGPNPHPKPEPEPEPKPEPEPSVRLEVGGKLSGVAWDAF